MFQLNITVNHEEKDRKKMILIKMTTGREDD